ncbi:hypothetical protein C8Q78DRAFT_827 [Trametes maxima]|nr:hypothetical protein C8Q78DRAFT_827 [Trametes maxima]
MPHGLHTAQNEWSFPGPARRFGWLATRARYPWLPLPLAFLSRILRRGDVKALRPSSFLRFRLRQPTRSTGRYLRAITTRAQPPPGRRTLASTSHRADVRIASPHGRPADRNPFGVDTRCGHSESLMSHLATYARPAQPSELRHTGLRTMRWHSQHGSGAREDLHLTPSAPHHSAIAPLRTVKQSGYYNCVALRLCTSNVRCDGGIGCGERR